MKIYITLLTFLTVFSSSVLAQNSDYFLKGTIVEEANGNPVAFATVLAIDKTSNENLGGITTDMDGKFELKINSGNVIVEISFIGFETKRISTITFVNGTADLGTIKITEGEVLDEVNIRAEKSSTEFKLDKRVFNVGKDLSSTGMGALELLNNVPSVNVSIEGQVSLRGSSGVQILIDGKPSILADDPSNSLGSITAEMLERIEVITNPSAKYDAEGTSGIINIVLKKDEKEGLNGSITLNTGAPHNHSVGLSVNRRSEKFNLFAQLGVGYREQPNDSENSNQDLVNGTTVNSIGTEYRNENYYNIILGTDYHIDDNNVITLSGNYAYEIEDQPSNTDFSYYDSSNTLISAWNRSETTKATNPKWQYELQYKKDFKDHKDHDLLFSALGRFFGKDQESEFEVTPTFGDREFDNQQTETDFQQSDFTLKLDYTKPFSDKVTMETGAQYVINDVGNDFTVRNFIDDEWVTDPNLTNNFEYDQKVLGVYGTGSYQGEAWGVKVGLRMEDTNLNTLLTNTGEANEQNYTDFFPSGHVSYKFNDEISLQGGYSTRIFRPRLWDLNPFFNIRNDYNIRVGNPNLRPEYTDSFEVTSIFIIPKASFNAGVYYRYTTDVVERVTYFEDNVSVTRPENIGTNGTTGVEVNFKYSALEWFSLMGDFNFSYFDREGEFENQNFDFTGERFTSRMTGKFKLPADFEFEMTGNFQSSYKTVQGEVSQNAFADLGIRKKVAKGKLVINASVRDVFNSRVRESVVSQPEYYIYTKGQRGTFVSLGLSYGFGKGEAMTYSSGRRR
ncbi:TonB-dependent receptor domain-containing protein [Urechidicola vernalis]|uniref:TonB-dependent receptor n=1 Tax=Urechidicola vernalis TaxID=3075600 RepID=A0ABU2Y8P7_9FLAO|nr:TonB-dependent receptor [Urechidicola sp. P050]MDT0554117.1 TonB-dependent receptor [Urechidicola sp. P050]